MNEARQLFKCAVVTRKFSFFKNSTSIIKEKSE